MAAATAATGGQAGAGEADAHASAEEPPTPPAGAPQASEAAQEATEPPTALPGGEFALDVDTNARRTQQRRGRKDGAPSEIERGAVFEVTAATMTGAGR